MAEFPRPTDGIVLTHFVVSNDIERSPLLHGCTLRWARAGWRTVDRAARKRLDNHQRRRWPDRRRADGHARSPSRPESGGVSRVMCQHLAHDDLEFIALLGGELAPLVA
jgi:hypothetical protein